MTTNTSRREFLKQFGVLLAGFSGSLLLEGNSSGVAQARSSYKLGDWTGDDFKVGHQLRDGQLPKFPASAEKKVDFVIVGGGLAGLSSAHYLKDSDFLLLEQYADLGGHARGGSYNGIGYSYGAAYLAILDGAIGELVTELNLKPVKLEDSKDAWYQSNKWLNGTTGSDDNVIYKNFNRLRDEWKHFWGKWNGLYPDLNDFPEFAKLDNQSLDSCLTGYDPGFIALLDSFVKSGLGGGISNVSTLAGISTIEDIFAPTYVLPGGNPALTQELSKRLRQKDADRIKTGTFVWNINLKDDGASVTYGMPDGSLHMVDCRHVIIATPHLVTVRVAKNLNDKAKATLFRFRYCSYLVANFHLRKRVFEGTYDNFLSAPFEIADITPAEVPYMLSGTYKPEMGSVLTVYVPYDLGTQGRTLLYEGNKKKLAKSVFDQLTKVVPQVEGNIEEIVLSRWGHALAVTRPQYFKYVGELQSLEGNSFSFAHSSAHGLPGAEAAVQGARHAVQRATAAKTSAKPLYSIPASKALQTGLTLFVLFILASVSLLGTAYAKPDSKPTLIYRISAKQDNIFGLNSVGLPAYAIVGGKQLKGTYLTVVKEVGQGHEAGLMAGDVILSINDRVTETPALTTQIITELSGQHLILRYARKSGDTLEVRQTKVYWVITAAGGSDTNSSGYDTTESYGSVRAKPRQESTAELESYMLQLVNNERAMNGGLSKLRHSDMLQAMAKAYADDMAKRGFFSHKNPEGQGTVERATAAGINVHIAENLSYIRGHDDPRDMVKNCQLSMMNEPADNPANHRGNLLDPGHKCVGIGVSFLPTGGVVTVQEFSHDDLP